MTHLLSLYKNLPSSFQSFSPSNTNCLLGLSNWVSYVNHSYHIQVLRNSFLIKELLLTTFPFLFVESLAGNVHMVFDTLKVPGFQRVLLNSVDASSSVSPSFVSYYETHSRIPAWGFISCLKCCCCSRLLSLQSHILDIIYRSSILNRISNHILLKSF